MKLSGLELVSVLLLIIGGLNWGLVGLFGFNLVDAIFAAFAPVIAHIIYIVVGLAALHGLYLLVKSKG